MINDNTGIDEALGGVLYDWCFKSKCDEQVRQIEEWAAQFSQAEPDPEFETANVPDPYLVNMINPFNAAIEECEDEWEDLTENLQQCPELDANKQKFMEECLQRKGFDYVL